MMGARARRQRSCQKGSNKMTSKLAYQAALIVIFVRLLRLLTLRKDFHECGVLFTGRFPMYTNHVFALDLFDSGRLLKLFQAFSLTPGKEVSCRLERLFIRLGLVVEIGVRLFQSNPFNFLLVEAEIAT